MGLVHAYKKGEVPASKVSKAVKDAAKTMSGKSVKKYAKTKHDDLPRKVSEKYNYKKAQDKFKKTGELPDHLKKLVKDLDKIEKKYKVTNIVVPGLEWMADLGEAQKKYGVDEVKKAVLEACQKGYMTHPTRKTKIMFGKRYRNCVKKEDVNELLKYPNDESKMLVAFLNTSVDGNKLKQVINKKVKNHRDFEKVIQKYHKSKGILKRYWKFDDDNDEGIDWVDYKFVYNQMKKHNYLESVNEYTYGVGDIVKDINPTCPHNGAMGKVKSVNPKSVVFVVVNKGKNYKPGDVLDKTHDQMKKMDESAQDRMKDVMTGLAKSMKLKSVVSMHPGNGSFSYFMDDKMEAKKLAMMLKKHLKRVRLIPLDKSKGDTANFVVAADIFNL